MHHLHRGKTIMLDCGIHPGYTGNSSLPYLDSDDVDLEKVSGDWTNGGGLGGKLQKKGGTGGSSGARPLEWEEEDWRGK